MNTRVYLSGLLAAAGLVGCEERATKLEQPLQVTNSSKRFVCEYIRTPTLFADFYYILDTKTSNEWLFIGSLPHEALTFSNRLPKAFTYE